MVGPLGNPSEVREYGTVVIIGGGVGTAIAWPTAAAMKQAGNCVLTILGARSRQLVILEDELCAVSDELFFTTDDGSYGQRGRVTDKLQELIREEERIDLVLAIGPIPMMRGVAEVLGDDRDLQKFYHDLWVSESRHGHVRWMSSVDRR